MSIEERYVACCGTCLRAFNPEGSVWPMPFVRLSHAQIQLIEAGWRIHPSVMCVQCQERAATREADEEARHDP